MQKKWNVLLSLVMSSLSLSAFASVTTCEVGEWCILKRPADKAEIKIYSSDGDKYKCTLSVDGKYHADKFVQVSLVGEYGFEMTPTTLMAHQGGSTQIDIKGRFTDLSGDPLIKVRRLTDDSPSSTNNFAYIMCSYR